MTIRTSYRCDICGEEFDDNAEAMRHGLTCGKSEEGTVCGIVLTISTRDMKFHARKDIYSADDVKRSNGIAFAGNVEYDNHVRSWRDDDSGAIHAGIRYIDGEIDPRKAARELIAELCRACVGEINDLNGEIFSLIERRSKFEESVRCCDEMGRYDDWFVDELIREATC